MIKMKYLCILFMICVLTGCVHHNKKEESNPDDLQYINMYNSMTDSVFLSCMNGIHYEDLMNNTRIYACSQLDCTHLPNSDCMAYPDVKKNEGLFSYPFIYNDKLYYFDTRPNNNIILNRSQLDGSNKEAFAEQKLTSLKGTNALRVGSKLYYWGALEETEITEDGYVDLLSVDYEIYEVDLETGTIKKLSSFGTYYNYNVNSLIYSDGSLYFSYLVQKKSWADTPYRNPAERLDLVSNNTQDEMIELLDMQAMIGSLNISTGNQRTDPVDFPCNIVAATKDRIFIQTDDELISYDKNWKDKTIEYVKEKEREDSGFSVELLDSRMIFRTWDGFEEPMKYYAWDDTKNTFVDLKLNLDYGINFLNCSKNMLLIAKIPLKESSLSDEWSYILADKKKFFKGELTFTDVEVNLYD